MEAGVKGILRGGKDANGSAEPIGRQEHEVNEAMDNEFSSDELREFLEADSLDVQADPEFKERLRRKLWEMVRARFRGGSEHE